MSIRPLHLALASLLCISIPTFGLTHYVDVNSTNPVSPYTNWATAADVIQDAVDAATNGATVLVTNGTYSTGGKVMYGTMTNRVAVDKPLTLMSVNGPEFTIIEGHQVPTNIIGDGAVRCLYVTNGVIFGGFTLRRGATRAAGDSSREQNGGGVWGDSTDALLSNCIVVSNACRRIGGGVYGVTLSNCQVVANSALAGGGAAESILEDSRIKENRSTGGWGALGGGGGAFRCALTNSLVLGNTSTTSGGGTSYSTLSNCVVRSNSAEAGGGTAYGTVLNCVLTHNVAVDGGPSGADGSGGASMRGSLFNCTLVGNVASNSGGGVYESIVRNCVVYGNHAAVFPRDNYYFPFSGNMSGSCSQPASPGNITNAPLFVDPNGWADLRLQSNSPCVNSGNNSYVTTTDDLDGNPRIVGGTVDMGAYEYQSPQSSISYAWLQHYGLPTDGSVDHIDHDSDKATTWQEWKMWTNPTNQLSVLRMLSPKPQTNGTEVAWQVVSGQTYTLERATNGAASFMLLKGNIFAGGGLPGAEGTMTFTDTTATNANAFFYRVSVPE